MLRGSETIIYTYDVDASKLTQKDLKQMHCFTMTSARLSILYDGETKGTVRYFITEGELKGTPILGQWKTS